MRLTRFLCKRPYWPFWTLPFLRDTVTVSGGRAILFGFGAVHKSSLPCPDMTGSLTALSPPTPIVRYQ